MKQLVLGIETSCDETAAAVVATGRRVRPSVGASQHELHAEYAGVVPEIASRAHAERIVPVVRAALDEAGIAASDLTAIAVGHRPGLIGSLLVGVSAAKGLAWSLGLPLIGVDHVHAHLHAGCLDRDEPTLPALGLVVSGGHTAIYRVEDWSKPARLGGTIDDAVGEAFDKAATILCLPHPGGPNLDRLAQSAEPGEDRAVDLPISRLAKDSLDFSFSGLKTAVLYAVNGVPTRDGPKPTRTIDDAERRRVAASFQRAAIEAIILKLGRAHAKHPELRTLVAGGGVTANSLLRARLKAFARDRGLTLLLPELALCIDNAAMIAGLGLHMLEHGITSDLTLTPTPTTAA